MADKSFGVKELNLLNASGTPTVTSPNNLNLNANTVAISTSVTVGQNLTVSANAGIASLNVTGIATVVNFNATGISTIAQPADSNPMANWTITNNSSSAYRFTGPGQSGSDDNPDLYLVRGHRYIFKHNATSSHPIQIRFANGGSAYTDGVTYSDTGNNRTTDGNNLILNVQHDAPAQLYYQCTNHGSMVGNIYIVGGPQVISGVTTFSNGINVSGGTLDVATSLRKSSGTLDYLAATHTFANVAGSTEYFRFASSGQLGIAGANYGTSGQVLTSGGASGAVSWKGGGGLQVLEQFSSPADGSSFTTSKGTVTVQNPTDWQALTTALNDAQGSVITYQPPDGAVQVIYEFQYAIASDTDSNAILGARLLWDGQEITHSRFGQRGGTNYFDQLNTFKWVFNIGGSTDYSVGRLASWTSGKVIKLQMSEYNSSYEFAINLLRNYGSSGAINVFRRPIISITAIGTPS